MKKMPGQSPKVKKRKKRQNNAGGFAGMVPVPMGGMMPMGGMFGGMQMIPVGNLAGGWSNNWGGGPPKKKQRKNKKGDSKPTKKATVGIGSGGKPKQGNKGKKQKFNKNKKQNQNQGQSFGNFASGFGAQATIAVQIDKFTVGAIIGKGGETIKKLKAQTGCNFDIKQPEDRSSDVPRVVKVSGSTQSVAKGLIGVARIIAQKAQSLQFKLTILIPQNKVGIVIGKGGATIKDIRKGTKVRIQIPDDSQNFYDIGQAKPTVVFGGQKDVCTVLKRLTKVLAHQVGTGGGQAMNFGGMTAMPQGAQMMMLNGQMVMVQPVGSPMNPMQLMTGARKVFKGKRKGKGKKGGKQKK